MDIINCTIKQQNFADARSYDATRDCPLWHCLHEMFPDKIIAVGKESVIIRDRGISIKEWYDIDANWGDIDERYVNDLISKAKNKQPVPEFNVVLTLEY